MYYLHPAFPQKHSPLIHAAQWMQENMGGMVVEKMRTGQIYREFEIRIEMDTIASVLSYSYFDLHSAGKERGYRYLIPLADIDPQRLETERYRCCFGDPFYPPMDEAGVRVFTSSNRRLIRVEITGADGSPIHSHMTTEINLFITTSSNRKTQNLPEKCVKVLEMMVDLCKEKR